ncbi:MAG: acyl carrier protein [Flavobacteriales bacterium]|nr:acyl carrier protein [Flavobacteriales bacterium]MBP6698695.1 acyl carrier protein [Flavobacteriales bacterium]
MNEQEIRATIRTRLAPRLAEMGLSQEDVTDSMNLTQTGVLDSFALMELLSQVEQELGAELDFDTLTPEEFTSLRGLGAAFAKALAT